MKMACSMHEVVYFEKISREKRLYYAGFGSSRLQKRTKLGENNKKRFFLWFFWRCENEKWPPLPLKSVRELIDDPLFFHTKYSNFWTPYVIIHYLFTLQQVMFHALVQAAAVVSIVWVDTHRPFDTS